MHCDVPFGRASGLGRLLLGLAYNTSVGLGAEITHVPSKVGQVEWLITVPGDGSFASEFKLNHCNHIYLESSHSQNIKPSALGVSEQRIEFLRRW